MIFLGAGASKPLGIPTMQEFSEDVFSKLSKKGYSDLIQDIVTSLDEFYMPVDFEAVYSILEGLSDPINSIKKAGPFTAFLVKNKNKVATKENYLEILKDARKIIYDKCYLSQEKVSDINKLYIPLFDAIAKRNYRNIIYTQTHQRNIKLNDIIVTTNYDMSLELFYAHNMFQYIDGFQPTANPLIKVLSPPILLDPFHNAGFGVTASLLIKLHGSIWQFEQKERLIKTIVDPKNASTPIQIEKEMMIYPTKEKDILSYGYYHFYNLFKNIQWNRLLVIGYSFRDEPINTAIIDNIKNIPQSKIIVFNPDPEKALNNLNIKIPRDRIILIPHKFGTEEGINELLAKQNAIM